MTWFRLLTSSGLLCASSLVAGTRALTKRSLRFFGRLYPTTRVLSRMNLVVHECPRRSHVDSTWVRKPLNFWLKPVVRKIFSCSLGFRVSLSGLLSSYCVLHAKWGEGVQKSSENAYVINGWPLSIFHINNIILGEQ